MRMRYHPEFDIRVVAINKLLRPGLAVYDGTFFLDENGPMAGNPVSMNLILASDHLGVGDLACCQVMGIDPKRIKHYRVANREGMFPWTLEDVLVNQDLEYFKEHQFRLKRTLLNWISLLPFHSRTVLALTHDSVIGDFIHRVLYLIRRNKTVAGLLYGSYGFRERAVPPKGSRKRSKR